MGSAVVSQGTFLPAEIEVDWLIGRIQQMTGAFPANEAAAVELIDEGGLRLANTAEELASLSDEFASWLAASQARLERSQRENVLNQVRLGEWQQVKHG